MEPFFLVLFERELWALKRPGASQVGRQKLKVWSAVLL